MCFINTQRLCNQHKNYLIEKHLSACNTDNYWLITYAKSESKHRYKAKKVPFNSNQLYFGRFLGSDEIISKLREEFPKLLSYVPRAPEIKPNPLEVVPLEKVVYLPPEIKIKIFMFLPFEDLDMIINSDEENISSVDKLAHLAEIAHAKKIEQLETVPTVKLSSDIVRYGNFRITKLQIPEIADTFKYLGKYTNLYSLTLNAFPYTKSEVSLKSVRHLKIHVSYRGYNNTKLHGNGKLFFSFPNLTEIDIEARSLNTKMFWDLQNPKTLRSLKINITSYLSHHPLHVLEHCKKMSNLEELQLIHMNINAKIIPYLLPLTNLKTIDLSGNPIDEWNIDFLKLVRGYNS